MADVIIKGEEHFGVTTVRLPKIGGGKAAFTEGGGQPELQTKTRAYTPSLSQQSEDIIADEGYDGLEKVSILVEAVASGTEGTPVAAKGAVSDHAVSVTPSVTNTAGYIPGSTKTGTPVTVSASELVSGSETKTANGTYDVTNLASLVVNVPASSNFTLLKTESLGTVSTSSTQATDMSKAITVGSSSSTINPYDLLVVETSVNTKTNGRHAATTQVIWLTCSSSIGAVNGATIATATWNCKWSSSGVGTTRANTTKYGIYVNSVSVSNGTITLNMYQRYNSTQTGTINGAYTTRVYGIKIYDLIGG